jgi:membrane protease YdiL (CAAX protease family)
MKTKSLRTTVAEILTNRFFIVETFILTSFIIILFGGIGFIFGLIISFLTLWASKWNWAYFGLGKVNLVHALKFAFLYTLIIILINDIILSPLIERYLNTDIDLNAFDSLKGNGKILIIYLLLVWSLIAFGEEFFFRGYLMNRMNDLLSSIKYPWLVSALLSSIVFGLAHSYQGISGMISTGIVGLILAISFYKNQQNLLVNILCHGLYDTYGILMIYFGNDHFIQLFENGQAFVHFRTLINFQ